MSRIIYYAGMVDENGKPIKRTPHSHPYGYDGYVIWRGGSNEEATSTAYSDRIKQENYALHNKLCKQHFGETGDYWSGRDPKAIEAFLRDFTNKPNLKLIFIMEYCHKINGYPYWRFEYNPGG